MNAPYSPIQTDRPGLVPMATPATPRQSRSRMVLLLLATFLAGIALSWWLLRPGKTAAPVASPVAANTASSGGTSKPAAEAAAVLPRDMVALTEKSRAGRIQTEAVLQSAVPQSGALPGKLVVDENRTARLAAPVTGRVVKLLKEPGERVALGDVLAMIDAPELLTVQTEERKAQVDTTLKASAAQRMKELYGAGAIALKELEAAQADAAQSRAELDRTRNRLRQLNSLSRKNSVYPLTSPIAGLITERVVTVGQQVRAEDSVNLFVISDLKRLNVVLDVPEADANRFALSQRLRVLVDGVDRDLADATIIRIGPGVDPTTRRVQVRAVIDNEAGLLRPEMYVRAFGTDAKKKLALELPITSLSARGSETAIFVERQPGVYERVPVQVMAQHPERAWVTALGTKTVEAGARVVSQGALLLDSEIAAR